MFNWIVILEGPEGIVYSTVYEFSNVLFTVFLLLLFFLFCLKGKICKTWSPVQFIPKQTGGNISGEYPLTATN